MKLTIYFSFPIFISFTFTFNILVNKIGFLQLRYYQAIAREISYEYQMFSF